MPKMKTHRGAAKRVRRTGSGEYIRHQTGVRHLLEHKSGQRKRRLQHTAGFSASDVKRIKRLLGD
jgi:large subunit ribosomal protein L35